MPLLINPILPGFHPDPSICRVGHDYYLATSSFEYFPGVPIFHSRDLVHWRALGHALTRKSQLNLDQAWISGGIYAPTLRYHDGLFYLTTTNIDDGGNFLVTARDPSGPWSDPVWINQPGIDPSLFWDDDGTCYYTTSSREDGRCRIAQSVIDPTTGTLLRPVRDLWEGTGGHGPEGPHLFKRDGFYYLLIAEGGTEWGHMATVARSRSPWGPWESCPHNPILTHRSTGEPIQCVGHADLVEDPQGNTWLVCLGVRPIGYHAVHILGRESFLAPVCWKEGWPIAGRGGRLCLRQDLPALPPPHPWPQTATDPFSGPHLGPEWNFIRNPEAHRYSLALRPNTLTLFGGPQDLDNMFWPTWVGRRQQHLACLAAVTLDFQPTRPGEEAGLTVFQNYGHHYEIGLRRTAKGTECFTRRRIGSLVSVTSARPAASGPIRLEIRCDGQIYTLSASTEGGALAPLDTGEARYLSTEVGGRFTGVYFALYAHGSGQNAEAPANFSAFTYHPEG
jgi:alpha-N-arabinofuranosidase